jgi:hypothetical protein
MFLAGACVVISGWGLQSAALPSVVQIGRNVQVSASKATTMHSEGMIAADPTDARRLLVCSMSNDEEIGQGIVAYASHDRGVHWQRTFPTPDDKAGGGDPACAFGPDGIAYLTMIPSDSTAEEMRIPIFRSEDGGQTWHAAGVTGFLDRESIVVDGTGGRFHNRVYVHGAASPAATDGARLSAVRLYASVDGGRTFGRPAERVSPEPRAVFPMGSSVVLSDGRWVAVFGELKQSGGPSRIAAAAEPENSWV